MINLLFFNPLNHFPIVHLVRTNHCPAVTYVASTASTLQGKKGMTQQLAEMTSKCFLPQAFANYQPQVLGGDPSSARVNRVTPTAGYNKDQTSVQPVWRPSMKPCYDDGINGTGLWGRTGLWDSGRKPLWLHWPVCKSPPGGQTPGPLTDVWENCPIHHGTFVESLWTAFLFRVELVVVTPTKV